MQTGTPLPCPTPRVAYDPEAEVLALAEQIARMIAVANTLVSSQRHVDITGLQNQVGLLCAKALDLPPPKTGFLKLEMRRLAASLDGLHTRMRKYAA